MFDKSRVPVPNPLHKQHLQNLYNQISTNGEIKALIEKKIDHVYQHNKDQIVHAVTVSQYFDQIWKNPELKEKHKDLAIKKLGAIHVIKKKQILNGEQIVAKTPANLEVVNGIFQMTPFEQFNFHEKLKNIKKNQQLDIENELFSKHSADINVVYALNKGPRAFKSANRAEFLHYTSGLCELDETERTKILKAEEFVKKIKDDKKAFSKKIKQMEKALGDREHDELELYKQKEQKEEEMKLKEKKQRLEAHIKELKARSEVRLKESTKFEEQYKSHLHLDKRPMFKEIERNFKKGYAIPELEERKKKLQEIRNFHKPITKEDIETHEQKVVKMVEERSLQRKVLAQTSKWTYEKPTFESKHHKTFAEELTRLRHQKENGLEDHKKKQEKVMELLQEVKDRHYPKADPQKELELANLVEQLKKRKDRRDWLPEIDQSPDQQIDGRKLGGEYLKGVKDMIQKYQKEHPKKPEAGSPTKGGETPRKVVNNRSLIVSPKGDGSPVMKDYLLELRKENKIQSSSKQVDLIIKNKKLDELEKKGLLESEVEKLEEKAKRKEMVNKYYKGKKGEEADADNNEEVDQIYINAIKAKLELLGN